MISISQAIFLGGSITILFILFRTGLEILFAYILGEEE